MLLILYDGGLRRGEWWISKDRRHIRGKNPQEVIAKLNLVKMADGGKVKFSDKVKSISMRLEGTKVPKNLEGDYGKRYNKRLLVNSQNQTYRLVGFNNSNHHNTNRNKKPHCYHQSNRYK